MSDELRNKRKRSESQISEQLDERLTKNKRYLLFKLIERHFNDVTYHNYSNTQMKVYSKDSFNRFGDDLTKEIFQYLTLEDKIRLECVSKQWQRCVYNKQFVIEIKIRLKRYKRTRQLACMSIGPTKKRSYEVCLESLLKKCSNIEKISIGPKNNSSVLSLIGGYCPKIKSLKLWDSYSYEGNMSFFRIYGPKLEELDIEGNAEAIKEYTKYCPNLKKIYITEYSIICEKDEQYLPKLVRIEVLEISSRNLLNFEKISVKYSQTMKILNIRINDMTQEDLKTCIKCIARFENLKELKLRINCSKKTETIDDCLSLIGQKCTKLLKLDLRINSSVPISDQFFQIFSEFKSIKKLELYLPNNTVLSGSVECFKHCKQLNELVIDYKELSEEFFNNFETIVPKLKFLKITTCKQYGDNFIDRFDSLKYIKRVELSIEREDGSVLSTPRDFGKFSVIGMKKDMDVILVPDEDVDEDEDYSNDSYDSYDCGSD